MKEKSSRASINNKNIPICQSDRFRHLLNFYSTKKFKVIDIINWKTSYSLVVEYFYDDRLHTYSQDVDEFEMCFGINSSEITKDDLFKLVLTGEFYHSWRESK